MGWDRKKREREKKRKKKIHELVFSMIARFSFSSTAWNESAIEKSLSPHTTLQTYYITWRNLHLTTSAMCNNVSQYVWLRVWLAIDVTVHGRKRRRVLPAPLATMSRNGQQWWRNCFQNAVYRIRRIESSVDGRQPRINTRGWRGSCTRVVSTAERASLPMITLSLLLTVYEGKFSFSKFPLIFHIRFNRFVYLVKIICCARVYKKRVFKRIV